MNDDEILNLWDEIHRQNYIGIKECSTYAIDKKVAILLYRKAEEQARASEREDVLYDVKSELLAWANQIIESQDTADIKDFAGYLMIKLKASECLGKDDPSRACLLVDKRTKPEKPLTCRQEVDRYGHCKHDICADKTCGCAKPETPERVDKWVRVYRIAPKYRKAVERALAAKQRKPKKEGRK